MKVLAASMSSFSGKAFRLILISVELAHVCLVLADQLRHGRIKSHRSRDKFVDTELLYEVIRGIF